jgi:hypothetical protein
MRSVERRRTWLPLLLLAGGISAVFLPVLNFQLMGDDFLLVQLAHAARHDWRMAFAALDAFYRPSTTWTLLADWVFWGHHAAGYHLTNLLLRIGNAALLFFAGRRLGLGEWLSCATALVWACSPFSAEPVYVVGARIDELLTASWLTLVVAWPRRGEPWTAGRLAIVTGAVVAAAFSKESWIVTAGFVAALEFAQHGRTLRRALVAALPVAGLTVLYMALHLALLPSGEAYFTWSLAPLAKVPMEMAAFLYLEPFVPLAFRISAMGLVGLGVVAAVGFLVWKYDRAAGAVAVSLLVLPQFPTLFVPYLPARYASIPYIGFLLLAVAGIRLAHAGLSGTRRFAVTVVASSLGLAVIIAGVLTVRADLDDMRRVSDAHTRLLDEARQVVSALPVGVPIAVVRAETENPLRDVARSLRGFPKLFYYRRPDAYGLTDTAALIEWSLENERLTVTRWAENDARAVGKTGRLVVHRSGGFVCDPRPVPDIAAEVKRWRSHGYPVQVIEVVRLQ